MLTLKRLKGVGRICIYSYFIIWWKALENQFKF